MALRSDRVQVPEWGARDAGKVFVIKEKSAVEAERWARRLAIALKAGTTERIPESAAALGYVGIAIFAWNIFLSADVDADKLDPLLDEQLTCLSIVRDPKNHPDVVTPVNPATDIEEVKVLLWLRSEIIRVHASFSLADAVLTLFSEMASANKDKGSSPA